ncbi:hypothetical protein GCM10020219_068340 [Nonomuraea dietziae]
MPDGRRLAVLVAWALRDGGDGPWRDGQTLEPEVTAGAAGGLGHPEVAGKGELAEVPAFTVDPADEQLRHRNRGVVRVGPVALVAPQQLPAAPVEADRLGIGRLGLAVAGIGGGVGTQQSGDPCDAHSGEFSGRPVDIEAAGVEAGRIVSPAVVGDEIPGIRTGIPVDTGKAADSGSLEWHPVRQALLAEEAGDLHLSWVLRWRGPRRSCGDDSETGRRRQGDSDSRDSPRMCHMALLVPVKIPEGPAGI